MVEEWTGIAVGKMHTHKISNTALAEELNVTPQYVSMVLNGAKKPQGAEERFLAAIDSIVNKKREGGE